MTKSQKIALIYWLLVFFGLVGVADVALNTRHEGLTLSERVRHLKDSVPHGDRWWTIIWWTFCYWLWKHILKRVDSKQLLA